MTSACFLFGTVAALIPAAGSGTRLGLGPKAFVEVRGKSLLGRSVEALRPLVDEVVVALPDGLALPPGVEARAIVGGVTRQDSVERLLRATSAEYVLIHDAARPFVPENVVLDLLEAVHETGAATVALPLADTLVREGRKGDWGDLTPREAWEKLENNPDAVLVDCRTQAEWSFVGVPDLEVLGKRAIFAEWTTFPEGRRNDDFVAQLRDSGVSDDQEVIFICRSGHRSIGAAEAATADGIAKAYNVIDGFEGALDENDHRGTSGWRAENLPWRQS